MVANLPYNVAVPIVLRMAEELRSLTTITAMVQREVAERLAATPGSKTYGAPSLAVAWWGSAKIVSRVPAAVFMPKPRVDSAVVRIDRHETEPAWHEGLERSWFGQVVRAAFAQRRKMLRSSLRGIADAACFERAGLSGDERAEQLDAPSFARLARSAKQS
jgi:16S rRNA (adenine1518-N6/adenine1519-N6)-dimethyltransferase